MSEQEFHCMYLLPRDKLEEDKEFDVVGDLSELHAKPLVEQPTNQNGGTTSHQEGKAFNLYSQILEFLWSNEMIDIFIVLLVLSIWLELLAPNHYKLTLNQLMYVPSIVPIIALLVLSSWCINRSNAWYIFIIIILLYNVYVIYFAEEDDLMIVDEVEVIKSGTKRKADQEPDEINAKRPKSSGDHNDDIVIL